MTANEMRSEFEIKLDVIASQSAPNFTDAEVSSLLSSAEEVVFQKQFPPKNIVDSTEMLRKNLDTMYVSNKPLLAATDQTNAFNNGDYWNVPTDHYYTLNLNAKMLSDTDCLNNTIVNVKPITFDEYNTNIKNPFKNPYKDLVWVLEGGLDIDDSPRIQTIYSSDFTSIDNLYMSYIKDIEGITVDVDTPTNQVSSLLPTQLHMEIVDEAVELAKLQLGMLNEWQAQTAYNEANK